MNTFRRVTLRAFMKVHEDFDMWTRESDDTMILTRVTYSVINDNPYYWTDDFTLLTRWEFIKQYILTGVFTHARTVNSRKFWSVVRETTFKSQCGSHGSNLAGTSFDNSHPTRVEEVPVRAADKVGHAETTVDDGGDEDSPASQVVREVTGDRCRSQAKEAGSDREPGVQELY